MQSEKAFLAAASQLASNDEAIRSIVDQHGQAPFWTRPAGFSTLVLFVLEQQVSLASAAATFVRLEAAVERVTPEAVLELGDERIKQAGVTRQKTRYILGLAENVHGLGLDDFPTQSDDEVRRKLVALTGIGPWTADVYLLSCLRRPDIWPVGDRALQVGTAELLGLESVPTASQLMEIGERWRPHRSTAARLIWHRYLSVRGR